MWREEERETERERERKRSRERERETQRRNQNKCWLGWKIESATHDIHCIDLIRWVVKQPASLWINSSAAVSDTYLEQCWGFDKGTMINSFVFVIAQFADHQITTYEGRDLSLR